MLVSVHDYFRNARLEQRQRKGAKAQSSAGSTDACVDSRHAGAGFQQ